MNTVEMKLQQLSDPAFNDVRLSHSITPVIVNGYIHLQGRVYYEDTFEAVRKSTFKKATAQNMKWVEKNKQKLLWELSDYKKELDRKIIENEKKNNILFSDFSNNVLANKFLTVDDEEYGINRFTMVEYQTKYDKYIYPFFKNHYVNNIDMDLVEEWQQWVLSKKYQTGKEMNHPQSNQKTLSIKMLKNIRIVLNLILKKAELKKYIDRNPLDIVKVPQKSKKGNKSITFLPLADIQTIIDGFDDFINEAYREMDIRVRKQFKNIFMFMIGSGLRSGELLSLKWSDINFQNETVSISKRMREGEVNKPKTFSSIRNISVLQEAMDALKNQKKISNNDEWVFTNRYFKPYTTSNSLDVMYKKLLKKVGLKPDRLYNLRHTYATNIIHNGIENITTVSGLLGHNDSVVTQKTYISNIVQSDNIKGKSIFG